MSSMIGFSTGALAYADFCSALRMLSQEKVTVVELSALRFREWIPLMDSLSSLDLSSFRYVSVHVPSKMTRSEERVVVESLGDWDRWPLILHPDTVHDWSVWRQYGA